MVVEASGTIQNPTRIRSYPRPNPGVRPRCCPSEPERGQRSIVTAAHSDDRGTAGAIQSLQECEVLQSELEETGWDQLNEALAWFSKSILKDDHFREPGLRRDLGRSSSDTKEERLSWYQQSMTPLQRSADRAPKGPMRTHGSTKWEKANRFMLSQGCILWGEGTETKKSTLW
jgi:hypothetical protein